MNFKLLISIFPLWFFIINILIIIWVTNAMKIFSSDNTTSIKILSRKRRFLAFPDGSSIAVALCMTHGFIPTNLIPGYPYSLISIATNWGLAYNLPNATWIIHQLSKQSLKPKHRQIILRRNRRDLYSKIELIIDKMGYDGKDCILRALCESAKFFEKRKKSTMLEEIIKTIFSLPKAKLFSFEPSDLKDYDDAYRFGSDIDDCSLAYKGCMFSILDLAFGKYTEPQPDFSQSQFPINYNELKFPG